MKHKVTHMQMGIMIKYRPHNTLYSDAVHAFKPQQERRHTLGLATTFKQKQIHSQMDAIKERRTRDITVDSRYLELRYLELPATSNKTYFPSFSYIVKYANKIR